MRPCFLQTQSLYFSARMALSTAMTITPTSAKMAAHMLAMPSGHERQAAELDDQGKDDVLLDDADALAGDLDGLGDLERVVVHQHDVGGLDGGVGAHGAHGDADVGAGQDRGVVDAVADEGQLARVCSCRQAASRPVRPCRPGSSSLRTSSTPSSCATLLSHALGDRR